MFHEFFYQIKDKINLKFKTWDDRNFYEMWPRHNSCLYTEWSLTNCYAKLRKCFTIQEVHSGFCDAKEMLEIKCCLEMSQTFA